MAVVELWTYVGPICVGSARNFAFWTSGDNELDSKNLGIDSRSVLGFDARMNIRRALSPMGTKRGRITGLGVTAIIVLVTSLLAPALASAATGTVYVRGSVTCPSGQPFVGAWVNSSSGGSTWASDSVYPGTSGRMAKIALKLESVSLPTTIKINVGCGGSRASWKYSFNGLGRVTATETGTVYVNVECSTTGCTLAPKGKGRTTNPVTDSTQCTYRAGAFWKQMTGSYHAWGGNAGWWDDNAQKPENGWKVRSWAEPDSLMVWQPSGTGSLRYGHVGYVADTRVKDGKVQVKIYDRNWGPADRNGLWIDIPSGAKFIRVPPRFTKYVR